MEVTWHASFEFCFLEFSLDSTARAPVTILIHLSHLRAVEPQWAVSSLISSLRVGDTHLETRNPEVFFSNDLPSSMPDLNLGEAAVAFWSSRT